MTDLHITGPNGDGEYWLHINADGKMGGINLGASHGPIVKSLLDTVSRVAIEAPAPEPVAWKYRWKIDGEYVDWRFSDHSNAHPLLNGFEEAPLYTTPPDHLALVAAAYRDAADRCGAHSYSNNYYVSKALHDASTDIIARTPADAQAALTAIERATYERGVRDALTEAIKEAKGSVTISGQRFLTAKLDDLEPAFLALLTQEGR